MFASPWPELTHLGLTASFLDRPDIDVLLPHEHVLPKLTSLYLFLGSSSDIVEREQLEGLFPTDTPIRRKIDVPLITLFSVQWPSLRKLWLYDMNKSERNEIVKMINKNSLPNLTELGISMWSLARKQRSQQCKMQITVSFGSPGRFVIRQSLDFIVPVCKNLTHLTLQKYIYSMFHLDALAQCIVPMQLKTLNISQSSGITGNLTKLFQRRSPSVHTLILSNCNLNLEDLRGLAKANVEQKLPQLSHLDISQNEELEAGYEALFAEGAEWNELLQLNCDQPSGTSDQGVECLIRKVKSGCLKALQKLTTSVCEAKILRDKAPGSWPCLSELEIRVPMIAFVNPLRNIVAALESGFLPNLEILRIMLSSREIDMTEREELRGNMLSLQKELNKRLPQDITNQVMGSLMNLLIHMQSNLRSVTDKDVTGKPINEIVQSNFESMVSSMIDTLSVPVSAKQRKVLHRYLLQFWATYFGYHYQNEVPVMTSFLEEVLIHLASLKHDLQRRNVSIFLHVVIPSLDTDSRLKSIADSLPPPGRHNKK